jgi:hypothetical protein
VTATTYATNANVGFETIQESWGRGIKLVNNGTQIAISIPGTYKINFNANVLNPATASALVSVAANANGTSLVGGTASSTVAASGVANLNFTTSVSIGGGCTCSTNPTLITIQNTASSATYTIRNIVIERVNRQV